MNGYLTAKEAAEKWNVSERQIQVWCKAGMIDGVATFGKSWAIPEVARKPTRTRNYKPERKPRNKALKNTVAL